MNIHEISKCFFIFIVSKCILRFFQLGKQEQKCTLQKNKALFQSQIACKVKTTQCVSYLAMKNTMKRKLMFSFQSFQIQRMRLLLLILPSLTRGSYWLSSIKFLNNTIRVMISATTCVWLPLSDCIPGSDVSDLVKYFLATTPGTSKVWTH